MKRGLFFIVLVLQFSAIFSQANIKATPYDTLGTSQIRIIYEMTIIPDTLDRTIVDKRLMLLEIGEQGFSRFTEYNNWKQDSISAIFTKDGKILDTDLIKVRRYGGRVYDRYQLLKSYPDASHLQYIGFAGLDKFFYIEKTPDFDWQLSLKEQKIIGGYSCSLAIGKYAGRTYKVWYAPEIAISDGPWKLGGLPGLILEVTDETGEYTYTCARIQKIKGFIAVQDMSTAYKTTRERFLKAFHRAKSDPGSVIQGLGDKIKGHKLNSKRKKHGYNPQEKY